MLTWLATNLGTLAVGVFLLTVVFLAVRSMLRRRRSGAACSSCGSCGSCSACKSCCQKPRDK